MWRSRWTSRSNILSGTRRASCFASQKLLGHWPTNARSSAISAARLDPALAKGRAGPEAACSRARSSLNCRKSSRFETRPAVGTAQPCIQYCWLAGGPFLAHQLAWITTSCAPGFVSSWPRANSLQSQRCRTRLSLSGYEGSLSDDQRRNRAWFAVTPTH